MSLVCNISGTQIKWIIILHIYFICNNKCSQKTNHRLILDTAESCEDGIKNQDETDVDCGGVCPACGKYSQDWNIPVL